MLAPTEIETSNILEDLKIGGLSAAEIEEHNKKVGAVSDMLSGAKNLSELTDHIIDVEEKYRNHLGKKVTEALKKNKMVIQKLALLLTAEGYVDEATGSHRQATPQIVLNGFSNLEVAFGTLNFGIPNMVRKFLEEMVLREAQK